MGRTRFIVETRMALLYLSFQHFIHTMARCLQIGTDGSDGPYLITTWGVFRTVDDSRVSFPSRVSLGPLEHSLAQNLEASPTVHLPLQKL